MPAVMIASSMPTASIAFTVAWREMFHRLSGFKKTGDRIARMITRIASPNTAPNLATKPPTVIPVGRDFFFSSETCILVIFIRSHRCCQHFLLGCVLTAQFRRYAALVHHQDPVTHAEHLGHLGRDQDDRHAVLARRWIKA